FPATASAKGGAQRVAACSASARHQLNGAPSPAPNWVLRTAIGPPVWRGGSRAQHPGAALVRQRQKIRGTHLNRLCAQNGPGAITVEDTVESFYLVIGRHNRRRVEGLWINQT